jgi:hypothetical protein
MPTPYNTPDQLSNAKMRFQSFFMLMTTQPCFFASSYYSAQVNMPTLVPGQPSRTALSGQ